MIFAAAMLLTSQAVGRAEGHGALHFEYGCEWGYTANLFYYYHIHYISRDTGARVDTQESKMVYRSLGDVMLYAGAEIGEKWNIDLNCGYAGIFDNRRVVPLTVRGTFFPKGRGHLKTKLFLEGGTAFARSYDGGMPAIVKLGVGKRIELARRVSLDFNAAVQLCHDRPTSVFDEVHHVQVEQAQLRQSNAMYAGINLSMALNFR